jgi:hypothetical protein
VHPISLTHWSHCVSLVTMCFPANNVPSLSNKKRIFQVNVFCCSFFARVSKKAEEASKRVSLTHLLESGQTNVTNENGAVARKVPLVRSRQHRDFVGRIHGDSSCSGGHRRSSSSSRSATANTTIDSCRCANVSRCTANGVVLPSVAVGTSTVIRTANDTVYPRDRVPVNLGELIKEVGRYRR